MHLRFKAATTTVRLQEKELFKWMSGVHISTEAPPQYPGLSCCTRRADRVWRQTEHRWTMFNRSLTKLL